MTARQSASTLNVNGVAVVLDDDPRLGGGSGVTAQIVASEALAAGDFVNVHAGGVRKATAATAGREAHGFVSDAVTSGNTATVYLGGVNTDVTGQTLGVVFLSVTDGLGAASAPTGAGQVVQRLGVATSATSVAFEPTVPITLA